MPSIPDVVATLLAHGKPVLCLDTCDLLDVIQCLAEKQVDRLDKVQTLLNALATDPDRLPMVKSYLVPIEWAQNRASVEAEAQTHLRQTDDQTGQIHRAWSYTGTSLPYTPPVYAGRGLVDALTSLSVAMMNLAITLDRTDMCIERALDRVTGKRRPSHAGRVKDSIHLEHYLELVRQLRNAGFTQRCLFVSANKADFWRDRTNPRLHPDLAADFAAVNLEFYGRLTAALGSLGL